MYTCVANRDSASSFFLFNSSSSFLFLAICIFSCLTSCSWDTGCCCCCSGWSLCSVLLAADGCNNFRRFSPGPGFLLAVLPVSLSCVHRSHNSWEASTSLSWYLLEVRFLTFVGDRGTSLLLASLAFKAGLICFSRWFTCAEPYKRNIRLDLQGVCLAYLCWWCYWWLLQFRFLGLAL